MKTEKIMQHLIGKTYKEVVSAISVDEDPGDCCGWAESSVDDYVRILEDANSAVLFDVVRIEYDDDDEEDRVVVNFIFDLGENKGVILGYELRAGSDSGYSYGATCTLKYGDEEVASVEW